MWGWGGLSLPLPGVSWDAGPRVVHGSLEGVLAGLGDLLDDVQVQPQRLCLRADHTPRAHGSGHGLEKGALEELGSGAWGMGRGGGGGGAGGLRLLLDSKESRG